MCKSLVSSPPEPTPTLYRPCAMTRRLLLPLAMVATAIVTACTSTGALPSAQPASLDGRTFLSTDVTGTSLVPGSQVRLTFKDGSLSANGGCNSMTGDYTVAGDRLTSGQMA